MIRHKAGAAAVAFAALCAAVTPGASSHPKAALEAKLSWRLADRYDRGWEVWDPVHATYGASYPRPASVAATFDLCGSVASERLTRFMLVVQRVGGAFRAESDDGRCRKTFKKPPELDGDVQPCPECDGPELPYGTYDVTYAVGTTAGLARPAKQRIRLRDYLVVSLGDSLASGEGSPDERGEYEFSALDKLDLVTGSSVKITKRRSVHWQDIRCHRSARAAHALVAKTLEDRDPHTTVTYLSLACSGAEVGEGVLSAYRGVQPQGGTSAAPAMLPAQLDLAQSLIRGSGTPRRVDALLLQIGINDLGFSDILVRCASNRDINAGDSACVYSGLGEKLANLRTAYDRLGKAISARLPNAEVYIADYPADVLLGGGCGLLALPRHGVTDVEGQAMSAAGAQLNFEIRELVRKQDWNYVGGLTGAFSPHAYCSGDPWFVRLEQSYRRQGTRHGAGHPNETGHMRFGGELLEAVVVDRKLTPSWRVKFTVHRVRLGKFPGNRDGWQTFRLSVPTRRDGLFTAPRSYSVPSRGSLIAPEQGAITFELPIYERPQPPRLLTEAGFSLHAVGGSVGTEHKPAFEFRPTCASVAHPCHVTRTPTGRYLATSLNGENAMEYSLQVTPVRDDAPPVGPPTTG